MCIVVCIGMFFDFIFINKIIVLMLFIGSYYHHIKFLKRPYSSINTLINNDFIAFLSITVRNHPVESDTECI